MTSSDPTARDELVAAYLDNEATPAERDQVRSDPELMSRVEVLRQVAELVAEPVVPPPAQVRERHIAAALASSATAPNVTTLSPRRRFSPDYTRVLSAAAVILVALLAGSLILLTNGTDEEDAATSSVEASEAVADTAFDEDPAAEAVANTAADTASAAEAPEADVAEDSAGEGADGADAPQDAAASADVELSSESEPSPEGLSDAGRAAFAEYENSAELAQALSESIELTLQEDESQALPGTALLCGDTLAVLADGQAVTIVGVAVVDGVPVEYMVIEGPQGARVTIVDTATCGVFDDLPLQ